MLKIYTVSGKVVEIDQQCRTAEIGCVECKQIMAQNLIIALEPIREKRAYYEQRAEVVDAIIREGNNRARNVARQTMEEVRAVVKV